MPRIAEIDGIVISINFDVHAPSHFHTRHQSESIAVEIETGNVIGSIWVPLFGKVKSTLHRNICTTLPRIRYARGIAHSGNGANPIP